MEIEELFNKSKWGIIKELSRGEKSALEIAKKTGQSIANITQQLKLLEAYKIVKKLDAKKKKKPGKPRIPYALNQEIYLTTFIRPGLAEKRIIKLRETDDFHELLISLFYVIEHDKHYAIIKYVCQADLINQINTIAHLNSNEKEEELLIITDRVKEVREKYSNMSIVGPDGKTKKIISWTHNKKEISEGIKKKEEYFIKLVKNARKLLDKKDCLKELKNELKNE